MKRGLNAFAKSIDTCQPAQFAQADMCRYFSLSLYFLHVIRPMHTMTQWIDGHYAFYESIIG